MHQQPCGRQQPFVAWMFKERRRKVGRVSRWFVDDRVYVYYIFLVHTHTHTKGGLVRGAKGLDIYLAVREEEREGGKKERSARHVTSARSSIPYWNPPGPTWPIQGEIYPAALPATYIPTSVPSSRLRLCLHPGIPAFPSPWTVHPGSRILGPLVRIVCNVTGEISRAVRDLGLYPPTPRPFVFRTLWLTTIVAFDSPESSFFLFNSEARNEIKIFGFLRPRIVGSQRFFVSFV